jgi:hypothetical protein
MKTKLPLLSLAALVFCGALPKHNTLSCFLVPVSPRPVLPLQVSIDDPPIVLGFMAASLAAFWTGFGGGPLALTAAATYYACGLTYEFT